MSVDKLVDSTQLDSDLTSVANAIRTKGGTSAQLAFPAGFVQAIVDIETGGYGFDDLAIRNYSGAAVLESATAISVHAFANSKITSIYAPHVREVSDNSFQNCKKLTSVYLPNALSNLVVGWFDGCSALETVNLPSISNFWNFVFRNCTSLKTVVCPSITNISRPNSFDGDTALKTVDFGKSTISASSSLGGSFFSKCSAFDTLILRYKTVSWLANINCFSDTPFADGNAGGTLYVPQALIADYQAASNWSTILGYANNQILPIEGSIYETQYADGTPITT